MISKFSKPLCLVIESIKATEHDNITEIDMVILAEYCTKYVEENLVQDTKSVPGWVHSVLKRVSEVTL